MSADTSTGLRAENLTVRYGGVVANEGLSLEVRPGEVVGLIGPNGAGKTTFVDAVSGFTPYSGHVWLDGQSLDGLAPHKRKRSGLSRTWQSGELFGNLTVAQNVLVAARLGGTKALWTDVFTRRKIDDSTVERALALVGITGVTEFTARDLTLGQQKLVGVARALVGACGLLVLDEPAAGLDSHESLKFGERVTEIAAEGGPGVLLIDHDMSLVMNVCHRLYVMEFGRPIFAGTPAEARASDEVVAAYLGAPLEAEHV